MNMYNLDLNAINLDSLNLGKKAYIFGNLISVDDCVNIFYLSCSNGGSANGHAPVIADGYTTCRGSVTILDDSACGGGGTDTSNSSNNPIGVGSTGNNSSSTTGAFSLLPPLPGTFQITTLNSLLSSVNLNLNQQDWVRSHLSQADELISFLLGNSTSQEAQNIANEILELSLNSPFNLDTSGLDDNILPLPDDGSPEAIKLKCIYEKLAQSPKFKQLFVDTFGQSENVNVKFEIVDFNAVNGVTADGATDANVLDVRMQTIKLDRGKLLSNHPLIVAQTIIHEALHAFINVKQVYCHNNGIIATGTNQTYITNLNQLTFDELLNDFYIDCAVNQHRLMYNQMVNAMDEMLEDVFNNLIAPEDQDLTNNPQYMYGVPPNDGQHTFNWQDAFHYFNLNGLQQATEYQQDILQDPATPFLVGKYSIYINDPSRFNQNSCN